MLYLLYDKSSVDHEFIAKSIGTKIITSYSPETKKKIIGWLKGVFRVLIKSRSEDTIICWYDFQAVLCWWICHVLFMNRRVICINLLLKDKTTMRNKVVSYLYQKALSSPNFTASVTSVKYGKWLNRKLGIQTEYTLVHDVFHDSYALSQQEPVIPNCVFCGGRNGRDWNFMMEIAREMPSVQFHIVMPNEVFERYAGEISENIHIRCNIPLEEFMKEMSRSALVCLPLNTEAPAGLIVLFRAAANRKMVITTDTATTKEYVTEDRGERLIRDVKVWKRKITYYLGHPEEAESKANNLYEYLKEECSEEKFVNNLKKMIQYEQQMD